MSDFVLLYSPRNSPGQNTGVDSLSLTQGIFPTQGSNPGLLHCRQILYQLSHKGSLEVFHYKTAPGDTKGEAAGSWVLLAVTLSELGPGESWAPETTGAERSCESAGARTREKNSFLLQCLSGALYWQSLVSCQLAREIFLKSSPSSQSRQLRVNLELRGIKWITGTKLYLIKDLFYSDNWDTSF